MVLRTPNLEFGKESYGLNNLWLQLLKSMVATTILHGRDHKCLNQLSCFTSCSVVMTTEQPWLRPCDNLRPNINFSPFSAHSQEEENTIIGNRGTVLERSLTGGEKNKPLGFLTLRQGSWRKKIKEEVYFMFSGSSLVVFLHLLF